MVKNHEKSQLRKRMLAKLVTLAKNEAIRRSRDVENRLSSLSEYRESKIIMFYYPIKGEVDVREIVRKSLLTKKVCLPAADLINKQLKIYQIEELDSDVSKGAFGIKEPNKEATKEVDIENIDLVVVPGLAFDCQKNRLGRGGGFYDRFLQKIPNSTKKIGVAFDFQILESLPVNLARDQKVDLIVTEKRVIE